MLENSFVTRNVTLFLLVQLATSATFLIWQRHYAATSSNCYYVEWFEQCLLVMCLTSDNNTMFHGNESILPPLEIILKLGRNTFWILIHGICSIYSYEVSIDAQSSCLSSSGRRDMRKWSMNTCTEKLWIGKKTCVFREFFFKANFKSLSVRHKFLLISNNISDSTQCFPVGVHLFGKT